jgi:hypothetical protein
MRTEVENAIEPSPKAKAEVAKTEVKETVKEEPKTVAAKGGLGLLKGLKK